MIRRLTTITVFALAACSDNGYFPTEVGRQQNIDDGRTTVPPEMCFDYLVDDPSYLIPACIAPPWTADSTVFAKARHDYEKVTVAGAGGGSSRGGNRLF